MGEEDKIQQECYMWFHNTYPKLRGLLFAVPNGGRRDGLTSKILKATGTYPGVSDMIFLYKGVSYLLETKTKTGSQSQAQKDWEVTVKNQGFYYTVFRSLEQFKRIIKNILENG